MNEAQQTRPIPCPRCGYDLSGVAALRREQGERAGQCSECGQRVDWFSLERADQRAQRLAVSRAADFVEVGRNGFIRRGWRTAMRALYPPEFFPWITERQPIAWGRVLVFGFSWLVIWAGAVFGPVGLDVVPGARGFGSVLMWLSLVQGAYLLAAWALSMVLMWVFTLSWFRRPRQGASFGHLVRLGVYGAGGLMAAHAMMCVAQAALMMLSWATSAGPFALLLVPMWLFLGICVWVWSVLWCVSAVQDYFAVRNSPVAWAMPTIMVLLVGLMVGGVMFVL